MNLLEKIIDTFDGVIIEDNQWTVDGSKGNRYIVEWDPYQRNYSCNCLGYTFYLYAKKLCTPGRILRLTSFQNLIPCHSLRIILVGFSR